MFVPSPLSSFTPVNQFKKISERGEGLLPDEVKDSLSQSLFFPSVSSPHTKHPTHESTTNHEQRIFSTDQSNHDSMDDLAETRATYEAVAERYRERWADREAYVDTLAGFLARCDGPRILDVGCGPGWESATMADSGLEVVGIDLSPSFLRAAREMSSTASFARMDMRRLGLRDDYFDGLWGFGSFHHVPRSDAGATLREFHRVLRPGAALFLTVKRGEGRKRGTTYEGDERRFTLWEPDELAALLERVGFEIDETDADEWVGVHATVR